MRYATMIVAGLAMAAGGWSYFAAPPAGVSLCRSAQGYLQSLSAEQRAKTLLPFETPQRMGWHFIPKDERKGLQVKEMTPAQREAAHQLLKNALSGVGYEKATKIMSLELILRELEKAKTGSPLRDTERYFFTIFGEPTEDQRWGLSVEGHHLSLNFVMDKGAVVASTPSFFGANPAEVKSEVAGALPVGTRILAKEERLAFDLINALDETQRRTALIADTAPREIRAAGEVEPPREPAVGLPVPQMTVAQRHTLRELVEAYLENMLPEVREKRAADIREADVDKVFFAWAGATSPGIGHYYRVQGPTFLIEFVNTQPDSAGNPANHIHCVWRDMRGDFGLPLPPK